MIQFTVKIENISHKQGIIRKISKVFHLFNTFDIEEVTQEKNIFLGYLFLKLELINENKLYI